MLHTVDSDETKLYRVATNVQKISISWKKNCFKLSCNNVGERIFPPSGWSVFLKKAKIHIVYLFDLNTTQNSQCHSLSWYYEMKKIPAAMCLTNFQWYKLWNERNLWINICNTIKLLNGNDNGLWTFSKMKRQWMYENDEQNKIHDGRYYYIRSSEYSTCLIEVFFSFVLIPFANETNNACQLPLFWQICSKNFSSIFKQCFFSILYILYYLLIQVLFSFMRKLLHKTEWDLNYFMLWKKNYQNVIKSVVCYLII